MDDTPLIRKVSGDSAIYQNSPDTSNPLVKRRVGSKTIVQVGSDQDNAMNPADASLPTSNRVTDYMKNKPGDENASS